MMRACARAVGLFALDVAKLLVGLAVAAVMFMAWAAVALLCAAMRG